MIRKLALSLLFAAFQLSVAPAAADTGVRVMVPAHDIARDDMIGDADLTTAMVPGNALPANIVTNADAIKGMEARRLLHKGEMLRADDVRRPVVVTRGQTVTMLFRAPGVDLTAMGRAMGEGGVGDTVIVQNPASYRMISGLIVSAGTVLASGPASPNPNQHAARN
jgi:flagellar basal body P-ring formation protein FlgA